MKNKWIYWCGLFTLIFLCLPATAWAADNPVGVAYRGHIQDLGNYPADGSWVDSPEIIGTVGQSKRIEGFEIKLTGTVPEGMELRYNVHVQNKGWLYDQDDPADWPRNGEYAGTRGDSLGIEAVKIVLTDSSGKAVTGYSVQYRGHVQNVGDLPADKTQWLADGAQLGTVGSSLRLEALLVKVVKNKADLSVYNDLLVQIEKLKEGDYTSKTWAALQTALKDHQVTDENSQTEVDTAEKAIKLAYDGLEKVDLSVYNTLLAQIEKLKEGDYTSQTWAALQTVLKDHQVTMGNSQVEVNAAVKAIQTAYDGLAKKIQPQVYDKAGTYGPKQGIETITGDATIAADGVILQNLVIAGNLTISEAVGDGNVTLNNVTVKGDTFVRGGGIHSIKINGGKYSRIIMEKTVSGVVRIMALNVDGIPFVVSEAAAGETIILEGAFESVTVNAPNMTVTTQGATTTIGKMTVSAEAAGSTVTVAAGTTVTDLVLDGQAAIKGQGNVAKAEVKADGVVFEKKPGAYTVEPGVVIPPVFPTPDSGGGSGGGYTPPTPSKQSLSISDPTVTATKVYDGTTSAAVTAGSLIGVAAGDVGNVTVTATASYDSKDCGSGKTIRVTYTLGGSAAAKYNKPADFELKTAGITVWPLTIANPNLSTSKEYDGKVTAAVTAGALNNAVAGDQLTVSAVASYVDKDWGDTKPITVVYTLGGGDAGNYTAPANFVENSGKITKKQLSFDGVPVKTEKVYDGNTTVAKNPVAILGKVTNEEVGIDINAWYANKNASDTTQAIEIIYVLTGKDMNNYLPPTSESRGDGKITPKPLSVKDVAVNLNKVYDGNTSAAITTPATVSGAVAGEVVGVTATANYDDKKVKTNKPITVSYSLTGDPTVTANYRAPASELFPFSGEITTRPLNITTAPTVTPAKMYDGNTTAAVTAEGATDAVGGDQLTVTVTASYDDATVNTNNPITVVYNLSGDDAGNYNKPADATVAGSIAKKMLRYSLSTNNPTKVYDQTKAAPVTASKLVGIIGTEDVSILSTTADYFNNVVDKNKMVTVSVTLTGNASGNYQAVDYVLNTGEITAKPLTVANVAVDTEKVYDGKLTADVTNQGTVSAKLGSEDVGVTVAATYDTKNVEENKDITVSYALSGSDKANYSAPASYITKGKITAKSLTITAPSLTATKAYDGTTSAVVTAGSLNGKETDDTVTVTATANYDAATHGNGKTITVVYTLAGEDKLNYTALDNFVMNNGVIDPTQLTINGQNLTTVKVYDGLTTAAITPGTLVGVANNETVTVTSTATYDNSGLGIKKPITVSYQSSDTTGNYLPPANYTINTGIIKNDIKVTSFNSSWSDPADAAGITMTDLPAGYTIFDLDNDGNVYAGASNGMIKKYSGDSWSTGNLFSGTLTAGAFKFAGIDIVDTKTTAIGVDLNTNTVYMNALDVGDSWYEYGSVNNPNNYQLVGGYYLGDKFYLVYQNGSTLFKYDPYDSNPTTASMSLLAGGVTIPDDGYTICGFNYTNSQLNMYLTK